MEIEKEIIYEAIAKATPRPMIFKDESRFCPRCNKMLRAYEGLKECYCKFCGQRMTHVKGGGIDGFFG